MSRLNVLSTFFACTAILLALGSSVALADVSYTDNTISFGLSPGADTGVVPQWDPALFPGEILVSVDLFIDITVSANVTAENDSGSGGNMGVNLTGIIAGTAPGLTANAIVLQSAGPVAVAGTDGNPGAGPDFVNFGAISGNDTDTDSTGAVGPYIGNGNIIVNVGGTGGFSVSGVSNSTIQVAGFGGSGLVTVTYHTIAAPEPGSIVLGAMGACGLAAVIWRRRRK